MNIINKIKEKMGEPYKSCDNICWTCKWLYLRNERVNIWDKDCRGSCSKDIYSNYAPEPKIAKILNIYGKEENNKKSIAIGLYIY